MTPIESIIDPIIDSMIDSMFDSIVETGQLYDPMIGHWTPRSLVGNTQIAIDQRDCVHSAGRSRATLLRRKSHTWQAFLIPRLQISVIIKDFPIYNFPKIIYSFVFF